MPTSSGQTSTRRSSPRDVRFLDRIRNQGAPKTPEEADGLALRQLAGRGADLAKPRHVIHFLYFPDEEDARAAATAIGDAWTTKVEPPARRSPTGR